MCLNFSHQVNSRHQKPSKIQKYVCVPHPNLWQQTSSHLIAWFLAKFTLQHLKPLALTLPFIYQNTYLLLAERKITNWLGKDESQWRWPHMCCMASDGAALSFHPFSGKHVQEGWTCIAGLLQLPANFPHPKLKLKGFQHKKNIHGKWGLIYLLWEPWSVTVNSQNFPGLFIKWLHSTGISDVSSQQHRRLLRCCTGTSTAAQSLGPTKCDRLAILYLHHAR